MSDSYMPNSHPAIVDCPNCNTRIYQYNQHACGVCGDLACYYCEEEHASRHLAEFRKEDTNAPLPT